MGSILVEMRKSTWGKIFLFLVLRLMVGEQLIFAQQKMDKRRKDGLSISEMNIKTRIKSVFWKLFDKREEEKKRRKIYVK